jgi:hypothetical protein
MNINKFKPDVVFFEEKVELDLFKKYIGGREMYSFSSGKSSIIAALKIWKVHNSNILVPYYICKDVVEAINESKNNPVFCDIDLSDLNLSYESVVNICSKQDIRVILAPSLYGNPSTIDKIAEYAKKNDLLLLNDSAQSIGSKLNGKHTSSYGDASITSFSPGKTLPGFAGGYLSINAHNYELKLHQNKALFFFKFLEYLTQRVLIDYILFKPIALILRKLFARYLKNDFYCALPDWVTSLNRRFVFALEKGRFFYRNEFVDSINDSNYYRVLKSVRGKSEPNRLVFLFFSKQVASNFCEFLSKNNIYYSRGYKFQSSSFPSSNILDSCIVDMPIDYLILKQNYLYERIQFWIKEEKK